MSQKNLENISLRFSKLQNELNDLIKARQQLETQYQENKIVKEEFAKLDESSTVFKLIGPVLVPQDFNEADINVKKRIEFIEKEIKKVEGNIQDHQKNLESTRDELIALRTQQTQT
ncbi:BA75_03948T0 [Komagataella pastoris]|uniref:BA75_03948T0 n=1 Tax=Komagataella pastoris TaxID=4922 RepID=A0A1B2JFD2_PICPA|nr:BA75_03948T0 [Komagataella pastoris]